MTKRQIEIMNQAYNHYGKVAQTVKCIEEMSELTKELAKELNGQGDEAHITEEIADVLITATEMMLIHSPSDVKKTITMKLNRLLYRMESDR